MITRATRASLLLAVAAAVAGAGALPGEVHRASLAKAELAWDWDRKTGGEVSEFRVRCGIKSRAYTHEARVPRTRQAVLVKAVVPGKGRYFCVIVATNPFGETASPEIVLDVQ